MRVTLKPVWSRTYPELTVGNVYRVLGIEANALRIISDAGEPILFHARAFRFVDSMLPHHWISSRGENGELYSYPPELREPPHFFEEFFDYNMRIRQKFHIYAHILCQEQVDSVPDRNALYLRIDAKDDSPEMPRTRYVEIDEERYEVRRIDVRRDGSVAYADGKGEGGAELGVEPLPNIDNLKKTTMFTVMEIEDEQFESLWRVAVAEDSDRE